MAQEIEFKKISNTYKIFNDKITVLKRKVLVEKINNNLINSNRFFEFNEEQSKTGDVYSDKISNYNEGEIEKSRIIIEKKLFLIKNKKQIKALRNDRYKLLASYIKLENIKSSLDDTIIDITSLENIDFNRPCTKEEKVELLHKFDYYVFQECIDEIECDIKVKDDDGIDYQRLDYGNLNNQVSVDITKDFTENKTKRLPDDYDVYVKERVDSFFSREITRRVLIEKNGFPTHKTMKRIAEYYDLVRDDESCWHLKKIYRESKRHLIDQELNEIQGDLHRMLNGAGLPNAQPKEVQVVNELRRILNF